MGVPRLFKLIGQNSLIKNTGLWLHKYLLGFWHAAEAKLEALVL